MRSRGGTALLILIAAFLLRGIFLNLALPYGDPLDEPFHLGYAAYLSQTLAPPRISEVSMPAEVLRPLEFLPCAAVGRRLSWREFAAMSEGERVSRVARAFRLDPKERVAFVTTNYEAQQPPLAYVPAAAVLRMLDGWRIDRRLLVLRLLATLLASVSVPLAYAFFRRLFSRSEALIATAAFVAFPGVGSWVGRFSNDAFALPIGLALLVLLADTARGSLCAKRATLLAGLLALGCWTKLYFLVFLPAAPLAALRSPRNRRWSFLARALVASVAGFLLVAPWLAHQRAMTGDWFGLLPTRQAVESNVSVFDRVRAIPDLFHWRFALIFARTFLWPGTWSAMGAPAAVAVALFISLAALALLPSGSGRSLLRLRIWRGASVVLVLLAIAYSVYATTYAAVARHRGHVPSGGPDGWYLLILFPIIVTLGCAAGRRPTARLFLVAAFIFLLAGAILTLGVLPAVYAGWSEPNGSNAPLAVWIKMAVSPARAFESYAGIGLAQASSTFLAILFGAWILSIGAALALISRPPRAASGS